jgi:azurin
MKLTAIALLGVASIFAGCSRSPEIAPPKLIKITGDDETKFDVKSFEVTPGQRVTLTLTNVGELPGEAMSHNWVLLAKGTDAAKFVAAGADHPETDYIQADQAWHVLFKTKLLGPGDSDSIMFTAPAEPGAYDYICSFPEHYARGMKGVMTVKSPVN